MMNERGTLNLTETRYGWTLTSVDTHEVLVALLTIAIQKIATTGTDSTHVTVRRRLSNGPGNVNVNVNRVYRVITELQDRPCSAWEESRQLVRESPRTRIALFLPVYILSG